MKNSINKSVNKIPACSTALLIALFFVNIAQPDHIFYPCPGPIPCESEPMPNLPPASPNLPLQFSLKDTVYSASESLHREKIATRTVECLEGCNDDEGWTAFASLDGSKQEITDDLIVNVDRFFIGDFRKFKLGEIREETKEQILTVGLDRVLGNHLVGFALGSSHVDTDIASDFDRSEIERDRLSLGMYYGAALPYNVNLTAQVLFSDDDYEWTLFRDENEYYEPVPEYASDFADYEGTGYSAAVSTASVIPLIWGDFEFFVEPSISFLYVKSESDSTVINEDWDYWKVEYEIIDKATEQVSEEWQFAIKWRAPIYLKNSILIPHGGFTYSFLNRQTTSDVEYELFDKDGESLFGKLRDPVLSTDVKRDWQIFDGVFGMTMRWKKYDFSAFFRKSINQTEYKREQYQLLFRFVF